MPNSLKKKRGVWQLCTSTLSGCVSMTPGSSAIKNYDKLPQILLKSFHAVINWFFRRQF